MLADSSLAKYKFICIMIATHGNDKDEIADRNKKIYPLSELYNAPLQDPYGSLNDIPKIFFINACRGETEWDAMDGELEKS